MVACLRVCVSDCLRVCVSECLRVYVSARRRATALIGLWVCERVCVCVGLCGSAYVVPLLAWFWREAKRKTTFLLRSETLHWRSSTVGAPTTDYLKFGRHTAT